MTLRQAPAEIIEQSTSPLVGIADWWERCELGDIAEVTNGAAFKSALFNNEGEGLPLIRIRDVGKSETSVHYSGDYEQRHIVESGDLVIGMDGDFRVARWNGGQALLNQRVCRLRVRDAIRYSDRFLEVVLQPYLDEIHKVTSSVTVKHLSSRTVQQLPIPLPPRAEQDRIAAAIEERFSRLDAVQSALELACRRLEALTTALLTEAIRHSPMSTSDWRMRPLSDVLEHTIGGVWGSVPGEEAIDVDVIRVTELRPHGGLDVSTAARRSITCRQLETRRLQAGDLVLEKSGGGPTTPVGRVAQFRGHEREAICTNFMQLLRPNRDEIDSDYLYFALHQRHMSGETAAMNKGSGNIRNIDTPTYLNQQLLIPPLAIQKQIATDLAKRLQTVVRLERSVEHAQPRLEVLRRAVLAAAFSGQLV